MSDAKRIGRMTVDYGEPLATNLKAVAKVAGFTTFAELARYLGREYLQAQKAPPLSKG
jgi:hypothetical protein